MTSAEDGKIHGTTWDVYLSILTAREPKGVRDVWRDLNLSSPSLAQYHINKLLDMRLIETTDEGKYAANAERQLEALRNFMLLRGRLIPRMVFYGALLLGVLASYLAFWPFRWDFRDLVVLAACLFSSSAFLFEAYRQYKGLTKFR